MGDVATWFDQLQAVDELIEGDELDEGVRGEENRLRPDDVSPFDNAGIEFMMTSVPDVENGLVKVPKIRASEEEE